MDIAKILGKNIRCIRKSRKLTQEKFAEMIGVETPALSKIECGRSYPSRNTIEKVIEVLDIPPYLLYLVDEEDFDIEKAYTETLELLKELKNNKQLFKRIYDLTRELCNKN